MSWRIALLLLAGCGRLNFPASDAEPETDSGIVLDTSLPTDGGEDSGGAGDGALDAAPSDASDTGASADASDAGDAAHSLDASDASDAALPTPPNYVFVTSEAFRPGDLGSLAAADAHCQRLADAAVLRGTFRAWLSTSTVNAHNRLGAARGWIRPDDRPVVDTVADLTTGRIVHPIRVDETGADVGTGYVEVVSGTTLSGVAGDTCGDWTELTGIVNYGWAHVTTNHWASAAHNSCGNMLRLYCFGIDETSPLSWTPATGRQAFVTAATFGPGGGISSADAQCQAEATAAGVAGSFRALLATEGASAASRFDTSGSAWVRLDGVRMAPTAADFMLGNLDAPLNVTAAGDYINKNVWTGATTPMEPGAGQTCLSWASAAVDLQGHYGASTMTGLPFFDRFERACSSAFEALYCLEQ